MVCSRCGTFEGDPCAICRTISRIDTLVTLSKLGLHQEVPALNALRVCAGALQDLVEAWLVAEESDQSESRGESEPPSDRERTPEKKAKKRSKKGDRKEKGDSKKSKDKAKEKKEKKKRARKSHSKSPEEAGDGVSPGTSPKDKAKKVKEEEAEVHPPEGEEELRNPGGRSSGSGLRRIPPAAEELQDHVDEFVTAHPDSFELATLPERGSGGPAGRPDDVGAGDTRRPREPDHPPSGREREEDERAAIPRRRAPAPKKSKGRQHRERAYLYRGRGRR